MQAWNAKASPKTKVQTDLVPDPIQGDPFASAVVVLALNPSLDDDTVEKHRNPWLQEQMRSAMTRSSDMFWLREELADTRGGRWWRGKLAPLIEAPADHPQFR